MFPGDKGSRFLEQFCFGLRLVCQGFKKYSFFNRSVPCNCVFEFKLFNPVPSPHRCSHKQFTWWSLLPFSAVRTVSADLWSSFKSNTLEKLCLSTNSYFCLFPRMARISAFWMSRGLPRSCSPSTSNTTISPASYGSSTCVSISNSYTLCQVHSYLVWISLNKQMDLASLSSLKSLIKSFIPEPWP